MRLHVIYSEQKPSMTIDNECKRWSESQLMQLEYGIEKFKISLVNVFSDHCNFGLYTLNVILHDHAVEHKQVFCTISVLDASPF